MILTDPMDVKEKKATRDGYGDALEYLGSQNEKVVALDADLSGSTRSNKFAKKYPERFFNFGVAEQNMAGFAAGLAIGGMIPYISSFAMFVTGRAWEIVRNSIAYPNLHVVLAGSHAGITLGEDGASHQTIEDIAITRVIPNMKVIVPADYSQAYSAVLALSKEKGPAYLRLGRPGMPLLYDKEEPFEIGKASMIQQGEDIAFLSTGHMVYESWKLAAMIEKEGQIRPSVYNFATIKPLDIDAISQIAENHRLIVTFEEHNVIGGFGSAVAEAVSALENPVRVIRHGIYDRFGQSGSVKDLLDYYQLSAESMKEVILSQIQ